MTLPTARLILTVMLGALAAGCLTTAEQIAERNNQRCVAAGHQPNTKDFNDCLTRAETDRSVRVQQRRQEMLEQSAIPRFGR